VCGLVCCVCMCVCLCVCVCVWCVCACVRACVCVTVVCDVDALSLSVFTETRLAYLRVNQGKIRHADKIDIRITGEDT
jgi:hypothetical protein